MPKNLVDTYNEVGYIIEDFGIIHKIVEVHIPDGEIYLDWDTGEEKIRYIRHGYFIYDKQYNKRYTLNNSLVYNSELEAYEGKREELLKKKNKKDGYDEFIHNMILERIENEIIKLKNKKNKGD